MYKSMLEHLTTKQIDLLRSRMWWTAQPQTPFLVKYASDHSHALLEITDLKSLWVVCIPLSTLEKEKVMYAKSLQIKESKDLLTLLDSLLSTSDLDPRTQYTFKEEHSGQLHFTFHKIIKIFDFNWTFKLKKVSCNAIDLICRQLLTPLASALQAQSRRIDHLKRKFQTVEKEYIRKMNEMEKNLYRSPLLQEDEEWDKLVPKNQQANKLTLYQPDKFTQFVFDKMAKIDTKVQKHPPLPFAEQLYFKHNHRAHSEDHFQLADSLLTEKLEQDRQKQKKEKKIDFI